MGPSDGELYASTPDVELTATSHGVYTGGPEDASETIVAAKKNRPLPSASPTGANAAAVFVPKYANCRAKSGQAGSGVKTAVAGSIVPTRTAALALLCDSAKSKARVASYTSWISRVSSGMTTRDTSAAVVSLSTTR